MESEAPLWSPGETVAFAKPLRAVHSVYVHCSASDAAAHDDVAVVRSWHKSNGWKDVGYHFFIQKSGVIQKGRGLEKVPAAQRGHNEGTLAICLHGLRVERFTPLQLNSLSLLCHAIADEYAPQPLRFRGHSEVSTKSCPVFDYRAVLRLTPDGRLPALPRPPEGVPRVLDLFSQGRAVEVLQNFLNLNGARVATDGVFGQQTAAAIRSFQRAAGLRVDGVLGPQTQAALSAGRRGGGQPSAEPLQQGDSGARVGALQRLLRLHDYWVPVDGDFGPLTSDALVRLQTRRGLPPTGALDGATRGALWELPSDLK